MAFLGNPEFGVEFTPIDFYRVCSRGAKGYTIKEPSKVKSVMCRAMLEKNPTVLEAYVDPFESPPMPSKVDSDLFEIWLIHLQRDSLMPKALD